jgi:hypothetical protein
MPRKVFTAGEVLAAADVNEFLMDQTVMSFAGTAARGSAIGTATEGMVTYLNDSDSLQIHNGTTFAEALSTNEWTSYTPTITAQSGTFTSVSGSGSYKLVGKTLFLRVLVVIVTNGTAAGRILATIPFNPKSGNLYVGVWRENNITGESGQAWVTGSSLNIATDSNTYPGVNSAGFHATITYEVA